jgi:hypothetical protein
MSSYEMPVIVRLSKEDLAAATGRPVDDPDVQRIGGLNVVLQPMGQSANLAAGMANAEGAGSALQGLQEALQPLEEELFQRLRSNPNLAREFLLNPIGSLEEWGLLDASAKSRIAICTKALAPLFAAKG